MKMSWSGLNMQSSWPVVSQRLADISRSQQPSLQHPAPSLPQHSSSSAGKIRLFGSSHCPSTNLLPIPPHWFDVHLLASQQRFLSVFLMLLPPLHQFGSSSQSVPSLIFWLNSSNFSRTQESTGSLFNAVSAIENIDSREMNYKRTKREKDVNDSTAPIINTNNVTNLLTLLVPHPRHTLVTLPPAHFPCTLKSSSKRWNSRRRLSHLQPLGFPEGHERSCSSRFSKIDSSVNIPSENWLRMSELNVWTLVNY